MEGHVGDRVIVRGRRVGQADTEGEIVEVLGQGFRVRWADGHETVTFPGSDTTVLAGDASRPVTLTARVDLRLSEDDTACAATATMATARGDFRAEGTARRHPDDHPAPVIGEELAVARALRALADQLEAAASDAIPAATDDPSHLVPS